MIDDEINFLKLLNSVLSERGYLTILASSGNEALEKLKKENDIAVILSDHRMPGMNGVELLEKAKELIPLTPRIIMTAYQNAEMMEDSINKAEVFRFITKPVQIDNLLEVINAAVQRYHNNLHEFEKSPQKK